MLDLIYIPTGRITRIPDEEAIRLYNQNKEKYRILDCGFEPKEPVTVDEKTVQELIMPSETEEEEIVTKEEYNPEIESVKSDLDIDTLDYKGLRALAQSLGLSGKGTREVLYNRIKEELDKEKC